MQLFSNGLRRSIRRAFVLALFASPAHGQLIGVEEDTGKFFAISTADSSMQLIDSTGIAGLGAMEFNPMDGFYYGFTTGASPSLYRFTIPPTLDHVTSELVGPLGVFAFEGGIAFSPNGTAYAVNGGVTVPVLFTLNLTTGAAAIVNSFAGRHDIAGLGWRGDGMLIGLDSTDNSLLTIDPQTAAVTTLDGVAATIGGIGGMALNGDLGYFVTAGPLAIRPGSNELYRFDPLTGEQFFVGSFDQRILGAGFSGLTFVPEPATLALMALGGLVFARRR